MQALLTAAPWASALAWLLKLFRCLASDAGCNRLIVQIFESMAGSTPSCQPRASVAGDAFRRPRWASLAKKALGGAVAVGMLSAGSAQALTWNWSFTGDFSSGQGTFTTAGSTPVADAIETITAITGTYTRFGNNDNKDGTYSITGMSTLYGASNTFKWDGTSASSIVTDGPGISFWVDSGNEVNVYREYGPNSYGSTDDIVTTFSGGRDGIVNSSSVSPVANVPGPLPILGVAAAFGFSRKLRKRIKLHKGTSDISTSAVK